MHPTPAFCYDRSVLRFSFACGLRPHAKLNPRTPLACACLEDPKRDNPRHRPSKEAAFGRILNWTTPRHRSSRDVPFGRILKWTPPLFPPYVYMYISNNTAYPLIFYCIFIFFIVNPLIFYCIFLFFYCQHSYCLLDTIQ